MRTVNDFIELNNKYSRDTVRLFLEEGQLGRSHFGGLPELPIGDEAVEYPYFECSTYEDDTVKPRPLHFLAQIDCSELAAFDKSGLLPRTGTLLFFYQCESNIWGFDPKDRGCARVIYYEGEGKKVTPPENISVFPEMGIRFSPETSYPSYEHLELLIGENGFYSEEYDRAFNTLSSDQDCALHKMTGWADPIQNLPEPECELISRGFYLGEGYPKLPDCEKLFRESLDEWMLLLQLESLSEPMFGDCGRIYFYIRREDLAARNFDRVWLLLQC